LRMRRLAVLRDASFVETWSDGDSDIDGQA
jgi:hypothetical protein